MASVVQYGRRRGFSKSEEASKIMQLPNLQQVTFLRTAEWLRIHDEMDGVNKDTQRTREAARQREALHLQSQEMVKLWPNTIAGQRQRKLEAKKIREQIEEEKRKQIDREEAEYREQKRKEAVEKAKNPLYHQSDRVKGLNRALQLTEVLKEREAQIELKQRRKSATKDVEKEFVEMAKTREDETLKQEQQKALRRRLEKQTVAEDLKKQMKENEVAREKQKLETQRDREEIERLLKVYQVEQRVESEQQENQKRNLMEAHLEHVTNRDLTRAIDTQKQEAEEQQRKLYLSAKQKITKLRKEKEEDSFREAQLRRERILDKLTAKEQEEKASEEQRIAKAVAERDARQAQLQLEEEERKAAMLESIAAHRELMKQQKEQKDKAAEQDMRDALQAKKEADRIFSKKQQLKAKEARDYERNLKDFNAAQMVEKRVAHQRLMDEELELEAKNAELIFEEENEFQQYSRNIINAAAEAKRDVFPLYKAAREGFGGGHGPVFSGVRPSYLAQDYTGAQMPKYVSSTTENIKKLHKVGNFQEAKRRLGFTW
ncbi:cilia- and flagella- associated protein 210 [Cololabis saira]|uniref:cilia- and flagella- associated protein 210 n=1 Tax=Cololabis saira TaxID=129043 RepID=UPI002AD438BD|nr:cilia- and flagella- associated protein 210 [Cololabis saira]